MSFADQKLMYRDCQKNFIFTVGQQEFYHQKRLMHAPSRRASRKNIRTSFRNKSQPDIVITCSNRDIKTKVPFLPQNGRPIYCATCY